MTFADHPEVSVIIPSKGAPACLFDALGSVLAQLGVRAEVIVVVDDCSPTREKSLRSALDGSPVTVLRHAGRRASRSRNLGLTHATGEWVTFLDHDDVMLPDRLAKMISAGRDQAALWVISDAERVDVTTRERTYEEARGVTLRGLLRHNSVPGGGSVPVIRRTVVLDAGGFDEHLRNAEDWDLWIRLAQEGEPAVLSECTITRRVNPGGKAGALGGSLRALARIGRKYRGLRRQHGTLLDIRGYVGWIVRHQRRRARAADTSYWRAN